MSALRTIAARALRCAADEARNAADALDILASDMEDGECAERIGDDAFDQGGALSEARAYAEQAVNSCYVVARAEKAEGRRLAATHTPLDADALRSAGRGHLIGGGK